jgi:hypothetical protein
MRVPVEQSMCAHTRIYSQVDAGIAGLDKAAASSIFYYICVLMLLYYLLYICVLIRGYIRR